MKLKASLWRKDSVGFLRSYRNDRERQHSEEQDEPLSANYLIATGSKAEARQSSIVYIAQLD